MSDVRITSKEVYSKLIEVHEDLGLLRQEVKNMKGNCDVHDKRLCKLEQSEVDNKVRWGYLGGVAAVIGAVGGVIGSHLFK